MSVRGEITPQELALILEALDDAAYYRETRSRVLETAVRRRGRESDASDVHRRQAQAYSALAVKLRLSPGGSQIDPMR
jgi:hypothetical protein